ncbi:hypothetical protein RAA17_19750 [Komagataeibacter rhaeticus]|nr:hypothetical protein [Komagataeibacter rhaeticus]
MEQVTAVTEVVPAAGDEVAAGTEPASRPAAIMPVQADMADNEDAEPRLSSLS